MSRERVYIPNPEKEPSASQTYELTNAENTVVCVATVEYATQAGAEEGKERKIFRRFELTINGTAVDLLSATGMNDAQYTIVVDNNSPLFDPKNNEVFIPEPRTLGDVFIALHEFGHAEQYKDAAWKSESENRGLSPVGNFTFLMDWATEKGVPKEIPQNTEQRLKEISIMKKHLQDERESLKTEEKKVDVERRRKIEAFAEAYDPEIKKNVDTIIQSNPPSKLSLWAEYLFTFYDEVRARKPDAALMEKIDSYTSEIDAEYKSLSVKISNNDRDQRALEAEFFSLAEEYLDWMYEINNLVVGRLERDATRRALLWARRLKREFSIDILVRFRINRESIVSLFSETQTPLTAEAEQIIDAFCEKQIATGTELLQFALASYNAAMQPLAQYKKKKE